MEEIKYYKCRACGCKKSLDKFYKDKSNFYDFICKECVVKNLDINNKDDILSFCKRYNIPYIENEWNMRVDKEKNSPHKDNLELKRRIFGKYLGKMKLKSFMYFTFDDTEEIAQRELLKHTAMPIPEVTREDLMEEANKMAEKQFDAVNRPSHYADTKIEVIDYIEDKQLGFCLGNVVKYVSRAGKKASNGMTLKEKELQDLNKAKWYLERRISEVEKEIAEEGNNTVSIDPALA